MTKRTSTPVKKPAAAAAKPRADKPAKASTRAGAQGPFPTPAAEAYAEFLPKAMALAPSEIVPLRADATLALQNVQTGVASVRAEGLRLAHLPETDVSEVTSLARVALAVVYANTQIAAWLAAPGMAERLRRASELRTLLLATAEALALTGHFSYATVKAIRAGKGRLDGARDLVALAALFTENAAKVKGKHAVSAAEVKEAGLLGAELVTQLKPGRARLAKADARGVNERDRLWTLVVQGHERLWRAGAYLFGKELVDRMVPPLLGARAKPRAKAKPTA